MPIICVMSFTVIHCQETKRKRIEYEMYDAVNK